MTARLKRRAAWIGLGLLVLALLVWTVPGMMRAWAQHWSQVDDPGRDALPITRATMAALAVEPGMSVADIGAGVGYYSFKIARLVGPSGRVYATDVNPYAVAAIWAHRLVRGASNVRPMWVGWDSFELAPGSVDRILIFNVYPFETCNVEKTRILLEGAADALRLGGRLVVYHDWVHDESWAPPFGPPPECGQPDGRQLAEVARDRFDLIRLDENTPNAAPSRGERPGYLLVLGRR